MLKNSSFQTLAITYSLFMNNPFEANTLAIQFQDVKLDIGVYYNIFAYMTLTVMRVTVTEQ